MNSSSENIVSTGFPKEECLWAENLTYSHTLDVITSQTQKPRYKHNFQS